MISVIIPNYNHSKYLHQRIESVLNQSYQDFEVIILDDCSIDNSREIIEQYRYHSKISHIVYNETNSGSTFKQWKKGLTLAKADYIWIAESDDYSDTDFLAKLMPAFNDEKVIISYCRSYTVTEDNIYINSWGEEIEPKVWLHSHTMNGNDFKDRFMRFRNIIPNTSAAIFRKNIAVIGEEIENMRFAGDWLFWVNLLNQGDIAYHNAPLNYFRQHENTTRSSKSYYQERQRVSEYLYIIRKSNKQIIWEFNKHYEWLFINWMILSASFTLKQRWYPPYRLLLLGNFLLFFLRKNYICLLEKIKSKIKLIF